MFGAKARDLHVIYVGHATRISLRLATMSSPQVVLVLKGLVEEHQ